MKKLFFLLLTIIVQFFYCQTNVSIYQGSGLIEQDNYNLNVPINLSSQVINSYKPTNGFELNFSWGANNGSRIMRPGGGAYTPMATFGIVVNGYKVWEARTPPDSNTESGDNTTYNGAYFVSGTSGVWQMQSYASLSNTATIRLPSFINKIQSIYLVGSTGGGGSGGDDFILQLNTIAVGAAVPLCVAGTIAPNLSSTSISNICPSIAANLTTITASNQPSGTVITWHVSSTATDSNKIANPNNISNGTYYASFYDSTEGCYSPTTAVTVTINNCVDTDGDGVYDDVDVDDDNDGIIDTVELSSCLNVVPNKSTITATSGISWSNFLTYMLDDSNADVIYSSTDGTSINGVNYLTFQFPQTIVLNAIELACHPTGILTAGSLIKVQGSNDGTTWTDLSGNITTGMSSGIITGTTTAENFSFSNTTSYTYYRLYGVSGSTIWWYLREANFRELSSSCDLDGDGISNDKDLDSDNDGCLDALEGGATITPSQLVSAGGTASVGTGSTALARNLCASTSCVSTSGSNIGLPQFATLPSGYSNTTGQTIGDSQNASVNSQCTGIAMLDAQNDINQTPSGVTASGNVITNDSVTDGSSISVQSATYLNATGVVTPLPLGTATNVYDASGVLAGSMTMNSNGTYTFVPATGYSGTVPVSYTGVSTSGSTDTASLSIEVVGATTSGNDKPIAQNDTASSEAGSTVSSNVLLNDSDPDGNTLSVTSATANGSSLPLGTATSVSGVDMNGNAVANAGTLTLNSNGTYTFVPAAGFTGYVNPISYTVSDGNGGTDSATISITILPNVGNSVFANDDAASAPRGTTISATSAQGLLANDTDPEGNTMSVTSATANGTSLTIGSSVNIPNVGSITVNSNGSYSFVPLSTFVGTLPVTYTVCDNGTPQACDMATLYVTSLGIVTLDFCYKPAATGTALDTNHGITALGRAGADNSNWPMVRKGAWTALEAKTKGFVVNRLSDAHIAAIPEADLREGMMVYNTTQDCLQINIDGTATGWKCYNTQTCPEIVSPVQLSCSSATFSPTTMVSGTAYTGTLTLPYTNGDASAYTSGSSISSTGVAGLTATLRAGTLANGAGNLVYDVTGTPSASGTASFPITFNGKSCNISAVVNDELSSNSIFINVDQESFYSGGIGLYSTFAVDFYGLPSTYNGSDYNITVNGITIKRSELYAGFRFYPLSCIAQSGNTCLRSGTYTAVLPNGKELSVSVTAPSQAPSMPSGSNSSRRQVCTDNGPDLPSAPYDGVCNNYNVN